MFVDAKVGAGAEGGEGKSTSTRVRWGELLRNPILGERGGLGHRRRIERIGKE